MTGEKNTKEIYLEITKLLWSVFPEDMAKIVCTGTLYDSSISTKGYRVNFSNDVVKYHSNEPYPSEIYLKIAHLVKELHVFDEFKKDPFTHFEATLTHEKKFSLHFAWVPKLDCWPRLFMKGVSQLTEEEAKMHNIPKSEWQSRVKKFKKKG